MMTVVGLMSGTSGDGIDAALVETDGQVATAPRCAITVPYEQAFREQLLQVARRNEPEGEYAQLESELTQLHETAVRKLCRATAVDLNELDAVGFHGHTVAHQPAKGITRQLGNASQLAAALDCRVVFNFRAADMAAGGQGAPLAPLYHRAILHGRPGTHIVLNLGGVGNVTWIDGDEIAAGDTGPGCGLLDMWVQKQTGERFDQDGQLASAGKPDRQRVEELLQRNPFFALPFPKSADRFDFDAGDLTTLSPADGAATLCALTVEAVVRAVRQLNKWPQSCWVTGGGRHHPVMMRMLASAFDHVAPIDELGHSADSLEAACFGWLAVRRLRELPTTLPATTGARHPVCGGEIADP